MSEFPQPNPSNQEEPATNKQPEAELTGEHSPQAMAVLLELLNALESGDTDKLNELSDQLKHSPLGKKIEYK